MLSSEGLDDWEDTFDLVMGGAGRDTRCVLEASLDVESADVFLGRPRFGFSSTLVTVGGFTASGTGAGCDVTHLGGRPRRGLDSLAVSFNK